MSTCVWMCDLCVVSAVDLCDVSWWWKSKSEWRENYTQILWWVVKAQVRWALHKIWVRVWIKCNQTNDTVSLVLSRLLFEPWLLDITNSETSIRRKWCEAERQRIECDHLVELSMASGRIWWGLHLEIKTEFFSGFDAFVKYMHATLPVGIGVAAIDHGMGYVIIFWCRVCALSFNSKLLYRFVCLCVFCRVMWIK